MTSILHGKFVWYELYTPDAPAARRFYCEVLGWDDRDGEVPGIDYHILSIGGTDIAGSMQADPGAPPGWNGYIAVDDINAAAAKAQAAGATAVIPVSPIPGVGHFAMLLDPQGACFGLLEYADDFPRKPKSLPDHGMQGHGWWRELHTTGDGEQALKFYQDQFGWPETRRMPMPPDNFYAILGEGAGHSGLFRDTEAPASYWLYYFWVDDIDAAQTKVEKAGGKIIHDLMEVPGGAWVLHAKDPQGVVFALVGDRAKK